MAVRHPGPWRWNFTPWGDALYLHDGNGRPIQILHPEERHMRLIAAAPELYDLVLTAWTEHNGDLRKVAGVRELLDRLVPPAGRPS